MRQIGEHGVKSHDKSRWRLSGGLTTALGIAVMFGWYSENATIVQLQPSFGPMQFSTALCFIFCGLGVLFFDRYPKFTLFISSLAAIIGVLTLGEYLFKVDLGLDQLFMRHYITVETSHPGRMAVNTALCFTMTGVALIAAAKTSGSAVRTIGILACFLIILSCVALIGYPSSLKSSYGWGGFTNMAVHTTIGFVILGSGLFVTAWEKGFSQHSVMATTAMFASGSTIVLWHVTTLHDALHRLNIDQPEPAVSQIDLHGTIALIAVAGVLGTGAVALLVRQLRKNTLFFEKCVEERTHELNSQKHAMDEHSLVSITDTSGKIIYANDKLCRTSEYSREELIGQDHKIVNSGYHPQAYWAELWNMISAGKIWHGDIRNLSKHGSLYWLATTIVPFKDKDGRITQFVVIQTDITVLKSTEEALAETTARANAANIAKSEFLASMSHEIRTPMTAILGFNDLTSEDCKCDSASGQDQLHKNTATIRRNGEYLLGLINDILDLSKIEADKMEVEQIKCSPCQIIGEVASLMRVKAMVKGLSLDIDYVGAIPETILSDSTRMRQILINLLGNAIKFTHSGTVRLVTRFVDHSSLPCLQFEVIDTGRGMTPSQVEKLFQPFMQADSSIQRKFGGTGLGLTISKRFAELLGGDLVVTETALGIGTTFRITVATGSVDGIKMLDNPMSATLVHDAAVALAHISPSDLCGLRILLVEDGPDNQRLISLVLNKAGADVTVVENGKLAIESVLQAMDQVDSKRPFDIILMDMQMPVMDGYEATEKLRQRGYSYPIIALTAHAMSGDRDKCIQAGCNDYATKPINRYKLIETIQRHHASDETTSAGD